MDKAKRHAFSRETVLPPCRVCGSKASGFHFGVISCEACKIFYRRYLKNKTPYICLKERVCEVSPDGKWCCSYCRLEKCIAVGMAKENVMKGRYSTEKKAITMKEAQELEWLQLRNEQVTKIQIESQNLAFGEKPEDLVMHMGKLDKVLVCEELELDDELQEMDKQMMRLQEENYYQVSEEYIQSHRGSGLLSFVNSVVTLHLKNPYITEGIMEELQENHKKYLEEHELREQLFGVKKPVSLSTFLDMYKATGIALDNRLKRMDRCVYCSEIRFRRLIQYARDLPGIQDFTVNDRAMLIKAACVCMCFISALPCFDPDQMLLTCPICGWTCGPYEFELVYEDESHYELQPVIKHIKSLELNTEEIAAIKAFMFYSTVFMTDHYLDNPVLIGHYSYLAASAVKYILSKNSTGSDVMDRQEGLFDGLVRLQQVCYRYTKVYKNFRSKNPSIELPELVAEFVGEKFDLINHLFTINATS